MTIKIEIKPTTYKATIGSYGSFDIAPLGAGAEAEMRIALRDVDEATKKTEKYSDLIEREKNGEKLDKESEEYKACLEALNAAAEKLEYANQISLEKLKGVFKGEKVDELFNDLTLGQLFDIHRRATKGEQ